MLITWQGRHGICIVGDNYAQGDRRDLAEKIMELEHARMQPYPSTGSHDLSLGEGQLKVGNDSRLR